MKSLKISERFAGSFPIFPDVQVSCIKLVRLLDDLEDIIHFRHDVNRCSTTRILEVEDSFSQCNMIYEQADSEH
jgi:hypothetical protein